MLRKIKHQYRLRRLHRSGIGPGIEVATELHGPVVNFAWGVASDYLPHGALVYSIGVGNDISFDRGMIERHDCTIHAFDPTPVSVQYISEQTLPANFIMHPVGLANYDGDLKFFPPKKARSAHFTPMKRYHDQDESTCVTAPVKKLETIMSELGHTHIDLLKIDIDGGEYDVLADMLDSGIHPDQLLIEFHHNFPTLKYAQTERICQRLVDSGYRVFHVSPRTYEMCLIHRDCLTRGTVSRAA